MKENILNERSSTRNGIKVMLGLIGMIKPLLVYMIIAIIMGCVGNLTASFITILGGMAIGNVLGFSAGVSLTVIFVLMALCAIFRGILRYTEQAGNHYIAFKLLARIRHQVFASLRRLAPAKLDGKDKGNLISIITSDIELLEVFYAHTISPIAIAVITSLIMVLFIGHFHWSFGIIAVIFYCLVGFVIPVINSKIGQKYGQKYRKSYGQLNTTVLDNLYGVSEILQFQMEQLRRDKMNMLTEELEEVNEILKHKEAVQKIFTDTAILAGGIIMAIVAGNSVAEGVITGAEAIIVIIALMSSFGPVAALSALSNNLNQTLASGNRVLNILSESPVTEDIVSGKEAVHGDISLENVSFNYKDVNEDENIIKDLSLKINKNTIYGIFGKSGCGKSTVLKLLMRFYETDKGKIFYGNTNVDEIDTDKLRNHISYVTQETFLFEDTIENNIKVANEKATREDVIQAAKKASLHEFIEKLPDGYDTVLSELGDSVSGGQRQRIGIARAFLHNSAVILLDEPTSNIDSLNEGIILKSLLKEKKDKTIVLVSHRKSTMSIADEEKRFEVS